MATVPEEPGEYEELLEVLLTERDRRYLLRLVTRDRKLLERRWHNQALARAMDKSDPLPGKDALAYKMKKIDELIEELEDISDDEADPE